jgi:acyl-ACP thioesterase
MEVSREQSEVELVPPSGVGRSFGSSVTVRLGDASPGGRMRLDALARVLQDVSDDDARDAGFGDLTWVVRRTVIRVERFPVYLERVSLSTWCAGFGAAWAERRIRVEGEAGALVEAATLWVHVDRTSLRPSRVPTPFAEVFGSSAVGRKVGSKAILDTAPPADSGAAVGWPLRFSDFDVLGHVNNASYWEPVEEALSARRDLRAPLTVVLEHGDAIERGHDVGVVTTATDRGLDLWLTGADGRLHAAVRVLAG